mgnify:CR=1 FL=1
MIDDLGGCLAFQSTHPRGVRRPGGGRKETLPGEEIQAVGVLPAPAAGTCRVEEGSMESGKIILVKWQRLS